DGRELARAANDEGAVDYGQRTAGGDHEFIAGRDTSCRIQRNTCIERRHRKRDMEPVLGFVAKRAQPEWQYRGDLRRTDRKRWNNKSHGGSDRLAGTDGDEGTERDDPRCAADDYHDFVAERDGGSGV